LVQAIHTAVKGRARYKIDGLYRSEPLKRHIEYELRSVAEISYICANPLTGNLLIIFDSGRDCDEIASLIKGVVSQYQNGNGHSPRTGEFAPLPSLRATRAEAPSRPARNFVSGAKSRQTESWHLVDAGSVLASYQTSSGSGLSRAAVKENLKTYGPNVLPESVPRSDLGILLDQFKSLPVALLGAAAGLSILTGGLADAAVILGVVGINAAIGYVTESQAEKTIQSLKGSVSPSALVLREGVLNEIKAKEVVPGDILVLRPGSYIAADGRLIETDRLRVDESVLTGESMPILKSIETLPPGEIPLADRINMVFAGTLVTGGSGLAVVVSTGGATQIGHIQFLVGEAQPPETPMERQLAQLGNQMVLISGAVCGAVFFIGLFRGLGLMQMLQTSIFLAVAAVPEGLPTVATTTLALGIHDMRRRRVLIRHLEAVETLGSVQTLCLDKTGTITLNQMSVVAVYTGMRGLEVSEDGFTFEGRPVEPWSCRELWSLLEVCVLCAESEIKLENGAYVIKGSSTENALLQMGIRSGIDPQGLIGRFPLLKMSQRSERRNFVATLHSAAPHGKLIAVKGNPEEVLAMCRWQMKEGGIVPLADGDIAALQAENDLMAGRALRVLGVAFAPYDGEGEAFAVDNGFNDSGGLTWLGLVGMADPIRKGVKDLIKLFHQAGIDTVMITGDQSATAYAIGKELDLAKEEQIEILDSTHLADIDPQTMEGLAKRVHVFARVSPAHKLQIVQAMQRSGKVVAMTGDGINDGPALKAADIGVAMGSTGTDVAREVADVVLEEDDLKTMAVAVSQGRTIYSNIRKAIHFLLATNLSEIMVMSVALGGGMGQPLNAKQLLWINLISDIFPGLALALEPPEPDVLERPPRDPQEPIIKPADLKRIAFESTAISAASLGAYGYGLARYGMGAQAGTIGFMSLTFGQLLHALSCRSEKHSVFERNGLPSNPYLNAGLGASLALQAATLLIPGLRSFLGLAPIGLLDGLVIGGTAVLPLVVNEGTKGGGNREA
jgi:Ca2+-transporting ATPase